MKHHGLQTTLTSFCEHVWDVSRLTDLTTAAEVCHMIDQRSPHTPQYRLVSSMRTRYTIIHHSMSDCLNRSLWGACCATWMRVNFYFCVEFLNFRLIPRACRVSDHLSVIKSMCIPYLATCILNMAPSTLAIVEISSIMARERR